MGKLEEITKQYEEAKARFVAEGKEALLEAFREFLAKYPQVHMITWTQYTPYFNDGEPCTFRAGEWYAVSEGADDYWDDCLVNNLSDWRMSKAGRVRTPEEDKFLADWKSLGKVPDDLLLDVFGNHVEVKVTREGIEVSEYDHD